MTNQLYRYGNFAGLIVFLMAFQICGSLQAQQQIVCSSNPVANYHVIGSEGSVFTWDAGADGMITGQGNDSVSVLWTNMPGIYTLRVIEISAEGCSGPTRLLTVQVISLSTTVDASICEGQSYILPDGSSATATGTYAVILPSSGGCDSIVTTNLTVNSVLTSSVDASICEGQSYTLPDGSSATAAGTYAVTLPSSGGCDSIVTTNLTVNSVLTSSVDASICEGQSYILPDGSSATATGTYAVILPSSGGCDSLVVANLIVNDLPEELQIAPAFICAGDSLVVTVKLNPGENIQWPDGSSGNSYAFKEEGQFTVFISNECGEVSSDIALNTEDCTPCAVHLPSGFSPNGDGVNDFFGPIITCDDVEPFLFRVYNRWNELVFETTQPGERWDGFYRNSKQPTDAYIFYLRYLNSKSGKEEELRGVVTLLN